MFLSQQPHSLVQIHAWCQTQGRTTLKKTRRYKAWLLVSHQLVIARAKVKELVVEGRTTTLTHTPLSCQSLARDYILLRELSKGGRQPAPSVVHQEFWMVAESSASRLDDEDLLFISYSAWGDHCLLWACERGGRRERQSKHSAAAETWTLANPDRGWLMWSTLNEQKYQDPVNSYSVKET